MRKKCVLCMLIVFAGVILFTGCDPFMVPSPEGAINRFMDDFSNAQKSNDPDTIIQFFTFPFVSTNLETGESTTFSSEDMEARLKETHELFKITEYRFDDRQIQIVDSTNARVSGTENIILENIDTEEEMDLTYQTTYILVRIEGDWKIAEEEF